MNEKVVESTGNHFAFSRWIVFYLSKLASYANEKPAKRTKWIKYTGMGGGEMGAMNEICLSAACLQ